MDEGTQQLRSTSLKAIVSLVIVVQVFLNYLWHHRSLSPDSSRPYAEQLAEARQLVHNLEELDRLQHVDPNDPSLDSVEAQMKLNLDAMKMHQDKHDDKNVTFAEYSQKKYYPFSINTGSVCRDSDNELEQVYLLMVIKSMTGSFSRRKAIRDTWGHTEQMPVIGNQLKIRRLFLLGKSNTTDESNQRREMLLKEEAKEWGDIIQGDFQDSFRNLTLKEIMFLRWLPRHCPKAQFIFKGDDDIFANVPNIVSYIESLSLSQQRNMFVGSVLYPSPRITDQRSKYYVSESLWPEKYYPPYVSGGGFIMSYVMAKKIFEAMKELPIIPIDDAFMGVCLRKLNLRPTNHKGFKSWGVKYLDHDNCVYREVMTFHKLQPEELQNVWKRFVSSQNDEICAQSNLL